MESFIGSCNRTFRPAPASRKARVTMRPLPPEGVNRPSIRRQPSQSLNPLDQVPVKLIIARIASAAEDDRMPDHRYCAAFALQFGETRIDDLTRLRWAQAHVGL